MHFSLHLFLLTTFSLASLNLFTSDAAAQFGGRSTYAEYPGEITITRVVKTKRSRTQRGELRSWGYEGYEVFFRFSTKKRIRQAWAAGKLKEEHSFSLGTGTPYVGDAYIEKYGIKPDKTYAATFKVITSGTSTPTVFEHPGFESKGLDPYDYFETKVAKEAGKRGRGKSEPGEKDDSKPAPKPKTAVVEFLIGSKSEGKLISRDAEQIVLEVRAGDRTIIRELPTSRIHAVTVDGKREILHPLEP